MRLSLPAVLLVGVAAAPALAQVAAGPEFRVNSYTTNAQSRTGCSRARRGVVTGCGGGNYCPAGAVTREQMAVFISATFGLRLYGP